LAHSGRTAPNRDRTGVFDDARAQRHRLRQCNTVADPSRCDRRTRASKISSDERWCIAEALRIKGKFLRRQGKFEGADARGVPRKK